MDANRMKIRLEVFSLRLKTLAYTLIQLTGFAILFYGIQQMARPVLYVHGYDISLPAMLATALPALSMFDALLAMFAGIILVWVSTASWF